MRDLIIASVLLCCSFYSLSGQQAEPNKKNGKWGFFAGTSVLIDYKFDSVGYKQFGFYPVMIQGRWGLIDSLGFESLPCVYDTLILTTKDGCIVSQDSRFGVISSSGRILLPLEYDDIDYYYADSISLVKKNGRWGNFVNEEVDYFADRLIFLSAERMPIPRFIGCEAQNLDYDEMYSCAMDKMLRKVYGSVKYPAYAREHGIQGRVIASFLISPDGKLVEPKIVSDIGGGCGEEVLRVVQLMQDWLPGMQDGQPVWCKFILPMSFKLQ